MGASELLQAEFSEPPNGWNKTREIIFLVRKLMQAGGLYTKELNKKHQVSVPQLNCIMAIYENGPLPPSQIARHILVKSSTVTGIVDRLEQKGLAQRVRNSHDRRVITVELTPEGKKLAEKAPPPIQQKVLDGLKKLPPAEMDQIVAGLKKLTQMLEVSELENDHSDF